MRLKEAAVINEWLRPLLKAFVYLVSEGICLGLPCLHNLVTTGGSTIKYAEFLSAWDERTQTMYDSDWWSALAPPERCGRLPPGDSCVCHLVDMHVELLLHEWCCLAGLSELMASSLLPILRDGLDVYADTFTARFLF